MDESERTDDLASAIVGGDRRALAQGITLVESARADHRSQAEQLLDKLMPATGSALRLGITGTPGVGKSTFIDSLGNMLVDHSHRVAVLAVDPSSQTTGGSILGDKTRMTELASRPEVFIRPSPSGGIAGGVAMRTRDALLLCEAAGFDIVLVETVGVGQSETAVATITDLFLLLLAPGGGDDLQGIKRGVIELADVLAVNKADGDLRDLAKQTASQYESALHLVRPKWPGTVTPVVTCSSISSPGDQTGLADLWSLLKQLHDDLTERGEIEKLRSRQAISQLETEVRHLLHNAAKASPGFEQLRAQLNDEVAQRTRSVASAARQLAAEAFRS